jgi:hypothetical protein
MLVSICSCAPLVSLVDLSSICRVISLDLVKTISLCCVICSLSAGVRINQLYRNNDQHHCEAMHLGFCMWIFFSFVRVIALDLVYKFAIFILFMHSSKSICPVPESLQECVSACVLMHLDVCLWIHSVCVKFLPFA